MKDLPGQRINDFEDFKNVLRKLFLRQPKFRDDWQVVSGDLDDLEDRLKSSSD